MPAPARKVGIEVRIGLGLALCVLAGGFGPVSAASADTPTYTLTFRADGTFEPTRLEVPAGRFKIVLVNESSEAVEFESLPLRKEKVLAPGVKSSVVVMGASPGEYPFFDDFHPQARGVIVVK